MIDELRRLAESIVARESERQGLAERIRSNHPDFFVPVSPQPAEGRFGAVDGGILSEEYQGFELVAVRAVGVLYTYKEGVLSGVDYYPSALPDPRVFIHDMPLEEENVGPLISLTRLLVEIGTARDFAKENEPDYLFLDGSILPQLVDKPRNADGEVMRLYREVIRTYRDLYDVCRKRGITLAGVVKDSKGNRVSTYLGETRLRDPVWLKYAMNVGEMTVPIPYADRPEDQATLQDVGEEYAKNVWIFYLKASDYDLPFRVEFYSNDPGSDGRKLASLLLPLSSANRMYTIPPFLLEADVRARLAKKSLAYIREYVERILGVDYNLFRMRGPNKPF